ncbi:lytic transglycosylase domain-containing protein [Tepidimonas alkaliphilus]|uniref:lytic transglycosylase domain-containing protein n=1 Tax=Tepidimonas alkaliphilus TaxID=2588942 RepID=UPI003CCC5738
MGRRRFGRIALAAALSPWAHARSWKSVDSSGTVHLGNELPPEGLDAIQWLESPERKDGEIEAAIGSYVKPQQFPGYSAVREILLLAARSNGLEPGLVVAVAAVESRFNVLAVSPKGALGLMQILPSTARLYGWSHLPPDRLRATLLTAEPNAITGAKVLADLLRRWNGRLELALAAYNAGPGAVSRYGDVIPPYRETESYVPTVLRLFARWRHVV